MNTNQESHPAESARAEELFRQSRLAIYQRNDRLFARLMVFQWLAAIVAAIWISPRTWIGATSQIHIHVWAGILVGGAIASLPVFLAWKMPGEALTRQVIGAAQMLFSALFIHLTGGRIETHFHVFGSLAMLAFYRDRKVLLSATVVVALDHMLRGILWPQSVFGVVTASYWRWVEHAGWVLFEDAFLLLSIRQSLAEMLSVAQRQASLEFTNSSIEKLVAERTRELTAEINERQNAENALRESQALYHSLVEQLPAGVFRKNAEGRYVLVNSWLCELHGLSSEEMLGKTPLEVSAAQIYKKTGEEPDATKVFNEGQGHHRTIMETGATIEVEEHQPANSGKREYLHVVKSPVYGAHGKIIGSQGILLDVTQRKLAEEKLAELHKRLVESSRQAGMAEIATSVLHNVGNVLNSINVASTLIAEKTRDSKVTSVARLAALIREHETDLGNFFLNDAKGKQIPGFLTNLASTLERQRDEIMDEVKSLESNVAHIKEIVSMQQNYAKSLGVLELLKITDLVEDAIRMNDGAISRHRVKLVREFSETPPVMTDKHKVLQILVNLIRNAKYACDDSGREDKQITLRVANGEGSIKISVTDNGIGIPPENLTRIFGHGFTTRKDGHGFGLHSGALAAKEMGGDLVASSTGTGQGATFTLILPVSPPATSTKD
ncbi:MAG TPA: ATP-binding protein [Verrucomicrobiae bacterium]|nr:ATP-binding protein [Verrucomicrobiae bacterium]